MRYGTARGAALVALLVAGAWASGCARRGGASLATASAPSTRESAEEGTLQARSLLGAPLYALAPGENAEQERLLAEARAALGEVPGDVDRLIWVGRRLAYLRRVREAIEVFSDGIQARPFDARPYRHRGHRWITLREFERAEHDLERAAELIRDRPDEVEPDGMPNARNIPLTTTAFNVWYHLGLARYVQGDFAGAAAAYERTWEHSQKYDDNKVATVYWSYLTLRRLGRDAEAGALLSRVGERPEIIENHAYARLVAFFQRAHGSAGASAELLRAAEEAIEASASDATELATVCYGIGAWHLIEGRREPARRAFERGLETGNWPAFGFIAAEAEMSRR